MKYIRIAIILAVVTAVSAPAQNAGTAPNQGAGQAGNPAAQASILRITSPKAGEKLPQNFVEIMYTLTNSGASAAGTPNFQLKLDSQDSITTNSTSYTFSGLTPGPHVITVQLVDANNTPVAGASSQVHFVVLRPEAAPSLTKARRGPYLVSLALRFEESPQDRPERAPDQDQNALPSAAGALPLLSVIGFGVLLGGIASAMRTRRP
ncbi:MAG: hypothetical protein ACR2IF_05025 [Terriglobales bacterium]